MADPPGHIGIQRSPIGKEGATLSPEAEDRAIPTPEPEHVRHLVELPVQRQLHQQQAVGHEHVPEDAGSPDRVGSGQRVDHVAGRHVSHGPLKSETPVVDAGRVELPGALVGHQPVGPDTPVARVGEHHVGALVEHVYQCLQPPRMPDVVGAGPGEVIGVRHRLERQLERPTPVADHAETSRIFGVGDPGVGRRVVADHLLGVVRRLVVDADQPEVPMRLHQQRLECLAQVVGVVVERRPDGDTGGAHVRTRRHPTTCL